MIHYLTSDSLMIPNEQLLVALSQFGHGLLLNEDLTLEKHILKWEGLE